MLNVGVAPIFALFERIADTLIGAALAWGFCYVLPSWESDTQLPALVARACSRRRPAMRAWRSAWANCRPSTAVPNSNGWLARREAYDSLSALVQATQRSLCRTARGAAALGAARTPTGPQLPIARATERGQIDARAAARPPHAGRSRRPHQPHFATNRGRHWNYADHRPLSPRERRAPPPSAARSPCPTRSTTTSAPGCCARLDLATALATQLRDDAARILQPLNETAAQAKTTTA